MNKLTQLTSIATLVAASGLACAESPSMETHETKTQTVSFNRAVAQSPEGAQALYAQLRVAAKDVCGTRGALPGFANWDYQYCKAAALNTAVRDVDVPAVSALHGVRGTAGARGTVEVLAKR